MDFFKLHGGHRAAALNLSMRGSPAQRVSA
jgi:hypothetical protein